MWDWFNEHPLTFSFTKSFCNLLCCTCKDQNSRSPWRCQHSSITNNISWIKDLQLRSCQGYLFICSLIDRLFHFMFNKTYLNCTHLFGVISVWFSLLHLPLFTSTDLFLYILILILSSWLSMPVCWHLHQTVQLTLVLAPCVHKGNDRTKWTFCYHYLIALRRSP